MLENQYLQRTVKEFHKITYAHKIDVLAAFLYILDKALTIPIFIDNSAHYQLQRQFTPFSMPITTITNSWIS